jgi:hypothetical protein
MIDAIVHAIRQCREEHIVEMDVLRLYRLRRIVSPTMASVTTKLDDGNVNDNMHATGLHDVSRLRSDGLAGCKDHRNE